MRIVTGLVAVVALMAAAPAPAAAEWLDGPLVGWNTTGGSVPKAEAPSAEAAARCAAQWRKPGLPEDRTVEAAGWKLFGPAQIYGETTVVMGGADADGMCRPLRYHAFVFFDGSFAGVLSPKAMDARTDGSLTLVRLSDSSHLSSEFSRYGETDPLCCPSRKALVSFGIERRGGHPVVVPQALQTEELPRR